MWAWTRYQLRAERTRDLDPAGGVKDEKPDGHRMADWSHMLALLLVWLVVDRLWLFPSGDYTPTQMKALGVLGNLAAVFSIAYVQWTGLFAG